MDNLNADLVAFVLFLPNKPLSSLRDTQINNYRNLKMLVIWILKNLRPKASQNRKENQGYLKDNVESAFLSQKPDSIDTSVEKGHGRIETRTCEMINMVDFIDQKEQWEGLKSLVRITAQREMQDTVTAEVRLYISSIEADAKEFNSYIRQHWAVENSLHWTLDVTFREDVQRKRSRKAA